MRLTVDRISVLLEYGMSEYQARVYLALLEFPALNAGALAKAAQIPRNRLYEVLEELQAVGLVDIILDESRRYRAQPLSNYLDRSVKELEGRIARINAQKQYLEVAFQPPALSQEEELETGATRVFLSRRAVARELDRLVESASRSLLLAGSTGGWPRLTGHMEKVSAPLAAKPGGVEIYLPRSAARTGGVERMAEPWPSRVTYVDLPFRSLVAVADEREMLLVHPIPDDDRLRVGRDFALLTTNPAFIRDHLDLVRALRKA